MRVPPKRPQPQPLRRMFAPADVTETARQGQGIGDVEAMRQMAVTAVPEILRNLPGTSTPMSALDAALAVGRKDYPGAAMAALGAVPFAGTLKYADEARDAARAVRSASEGAPSIRAWHGSPHRGIEKTGFDASRIGTGEGVQAYGHGLYFAESRPLAEYYQKTLSKGKPGALYEVDIQARPEQMLRWDYPLSEQSPEILRAVNAAKQEVFVPLEQRSRKDLSRIMQRVDPEGDWAGIDSPMPYKRDLVQYMKDEGILEDMMNPVNPSLSGRAAHDLLVQAAGGGGRVKNPAQAKAAEALRAQGVPGISYFDRLSREAKLGNLNHVVFDPMRVKILRALGLLGVAGGTAGAAVAGQRGEDDA